MLVSLHAGRKADTHTYNDKWPTEQLFLFEWMERVYILVYNMNFICHVLTTYKMQLVTIGGNLCVGLMTVAHDGQSFFISI